MSFISNLQNDAAIVEGNRPTLFFYRVWNTLASALQGLLRPPAASTPALNGDLVLELTNNTTLKIKVKGLDGVIRSVSLTLV